MPFSLLSDFIELSKQSLHLAFFVICIQLLHELVKFVVKQYKSRLNCQFTFHVTKVFFYVCAEKLLTNLTSLLYVSKLGLKTGQKVLQSDFDLTRIADLAFR